MFNKFFLRKLHSDDVPIKCYVAKVITLQRILFVCFFNCICSFIRVDVHCRVIFTSLQA